MSDHKRAILNDPYTSSFLLAARDFATGRGDIAHFGTPFRDCPQGRFRMGWKHWYEFELCGPNTKWSGGPDCYRNALPHKPDAGWVLPRWWKVFDLDESDADKGRGRSLAQITAELPNDWFCMVPTQTPGNYQIWYLLRTPIDDDQERELRVHGALWGGDPHFYDNTIAANPVRYHYQPHPDGRATIWNPQILDGVLPTVEFADLLHPAYQQTVDLITAKVEACADLDSREQSVWDNLNSSSSDWATTTDFKQVQTYVFGMASTVVGAAGRSDLIRKYIRAASKQGLAGEELVLEVLRLNATFAEPKTEQQVRLLVRQHLDWKKRMDLSRQKSIETRVNNAFNSYVGLVSQRLANSTSSINKFNKVLDMYTSIDTTEYQQLQNYYSTSSLPYTEVTNVQRKKLSVNCKAGYNRVLDLDTLMEYVNPQRPSHIRRGFETKAEKIHNAA